MDAVIEVRDLVFDYPTKRALHGVSFIAKPGTVTALVGPNGAGKTTLMRCLAALDTPFSGSISVAGVDVLEDPRECHRRVGYLSDFYGLYDDLTVTQCLVYAGRSRGVLQQGINEAVTDVVVKLNLKGYEGARAGTLSRGLRQRLAIAQAIVHRPPVLLLDEPAAGLDPEARFALAALLRELSASGMTLIVSSHILAELEDYSTDMLTIHDGRVAGSRSVSEVESGAKTAIRVRLVNPHPALMELLTHTPEVSQVQLLQIPNGIHGAQFVFSGDAVAQQQLLQRLIAAGLPVCEFAVEKQSLQSVYLRQVSDGSKHLTQPKRE